MKKQTNYVKGRNFEYRVMKYLKDRGFFCMRAYGSKGMYDILAIQPFVDFGWYNYSLLIQAKLNGYVPPKEMQTLKENEWNWQGITIIAWRDKKSRKLRFRNLEGIELVV